VLNVTAVDGTTGGYFTIYPADQTRPTATTVAFGPGGVVGNEVTVKLSAAGAVTIYNNQGTTDAIVDVEGYFANQTNPLTTATYTYSGDNLRMTKQTNGGAKNQMLWDTADNPPLLLSDGTNTYIYGPDNLPLEQYTATTCTTACWYQHDQQGSTIALLNQTNGPNQPATIAATATYTPYGQVASTSSPTTLSSLTPSATTPNTPTPNPDSSTSSTATTAPPPGSS
jgi:hypothetical protein